MRFAKNRSVFVDSNHVYNGDIRCADNTEELATGNLAVKGVITCFRQ